MKAVVVCAAQATIGLAALAVKRDHLVQAVTQGGEVAGLAFEARVAYVAATATP